MNGFPILICDDSMLARKSARKALPRDWLVDVTYAANGREAVQALQNQHFGLVLLDLTMPEMDGVQVLEAIREHKWETFVIVISGDIQPQMKDRVMSLGALDFINKPVKAERLGAILEMYGLFQASLVE